MLSVGTNLLGVFISPLSVSILFRSSGFKVQLDVTSLLIELLLTIALPMVIGYVIPNSAVIVDIASNNSCRSQVC